LKCEVKLCIRGFNIVAIFSTGQDSYYKTTKEKSYSRSGLWHPCEFGKTTRPGIPNPQEIYKELKKKIVRLL
jgi:hypothetical protein